jgi:hypothetical protein
MHRLSPNRLSPQTRTSIKDLAQRVDRVAGHLNVLLVVIALGLATLDFTFFVTEKVVDNLPPITQVSDAPASTAAH